MNYITSNKYTFFYILSIVLVNIGFIYVPMIPLLGQMFPPMTLIVGLVFILRDSKKDLAAKKGENKVIGSNYRAKKLERTISLDDYIAELGEDLGRKGYDLDQARQKSLLKSHGYDVSVSQEK